MTITEKIATGLTLLLVGVIGWIGTDLTRQAVRSAWKPTETAVEQRFSLYRETHDGIAVGVLTDKNTGAEYLVISGYGTSIIKTK